MFLILLYSYSLFLIWIPRIEFTVPCQTPAHFCQNYLSFSYVNNLCGVIFWGNLVRVMVMERLMANGCFS
ncbi:hypothetical protein BDV30DRAFT_15025 [Aspergillus minisclerotigenes]|uniref:Uncharacterized protein n=1 Tax=Aspergillus minisclerotigenes TaxID=656917 RepID=A0A5N6INY7_9EURO|nr:hypothetical protein BDV30DRAFT_15025 [Aspergillus minisclerotigenes]